MLSGFESPALSPRPQHSKQPKGPPFWRGGARSVAWIALAAFLLLAIAAAATHGLILPGVTALGVDLGGKTQSQAAAALDEVWRSQRLTLRAGERTWAVTARSLGIEIDAVAMAGRAYRASRSLERLGRGKTVVSPVLRVDERVVEARLAALAPDLYVAPQDARLHVVDGRLEALPAAPGMKLDVAATTGWLVQSAHQAVVQGVLDLAIEPLAPQITDVSALVERGNAWLSHTLSIRAYDPIADEMLTWTVEPETWAAWLSLAVDEEAASGFAWTLDAVEVAAFVQARAEALGETRYITPDNLVNDVQGAIVDESWTVDLRVYHTARRHVVRAGETLSSIARLYGMPYPWLEQANPGVKTLSPGQVIAIPSPDLMLPLPVVEGKRIVVSISRQVVWVYENGAIKWVWPVSTGIASSPTSPGVFQIQSHDENAYAASWDLWMPYFMGIYRPAPAANFMNGFHGFPTRGGATLLWTGNLGAPVTFGCILLDTGNAAALYRWAQEGVVVEIIE